MVYRREGLQYGALYDILTIHICKHSIIKNVIIAYRVERKIKMSEITREEFENIYSKAMRGDAEAQSFIGICYMTAECVDEDPDQAAFWLKKAAEQGDADAQYFLCTCYLDGYGVDEDTEAAFDWLMKAANQGHADAMYDLAMSLYEGDSEEEKETALDLFKAAAEQGHEDAQAFINEYAREKSRQRVRSYKNIENWDAEPFEGASQGRTIEDVLEEQRRALQEVSRKVNPHEIGSSKTVFSTIDIWGDEED